MIFLTPTQLAVFTAAILGHFVGDYTFQNQWMAIGKSQPGRLGHIACTAHVLAYTFAIFLLAGWHPLFLLAVAVPHWIIDRWSLAVPILRLKNGFHPFYGVWEECPDYDEEKREAALIKNVWKVSFAAPVYIFNDNVLHWVCLYFTVMWLFK